MRSSTMPPVASSQHSVYCACPGPIRPRALVRQESTYAAAPGPVDPDLAEVADVEDADPLPDGRVLLQHPAAVLQGHLPAAERRELRAERDVPVVEGRAVQAVSPAVAPAASSAMAATYPSASPGSR